MRRFWMFYAWTVGMYVLGSIAISAGPSVEAAYFPVRIDQKIEAVERVEERLCWTWASEKVRPLASDDLDAYLHDRLADRMVVSVFRAEDGMPWRAGGAMGVGKHRLRYCTTLPPHVRPDETVSVEQRAWYPGPLGLWRFPLLIPTVFSPGIDPPAAR